MKFEPKKNAWKGLRAAGGVVLAAALVAGIEALLGQADTAEELMKLGAPALAIPLLLAAGAMARNALKNYKATPDE